MNDTESAELLSEPKKTMKRPIFLPRTFPCMPKNSRKQVWHHNCCGRSTDKTIQRVYNTPISASITRSGGKRPRSPCILTTNRGQDVHQLYGSENGYYLNWNRLENSGWNLYRHTSLHPVYLMPRPRLLNIKKPLWGRLRAPFDISVELYWPWCPFKIA